MDNLGLVAAKAVIELDEAAIEADVAVALAARWGGAQRREIR